MSETKGTPNRGTNRMSKECGVKVNIPGAAKVASMMTSIICNNGKTDRSWMRAYGKAVYHAEANKKKAQHEMNRQQHQEPTSD